MPILTIQNQGLSSRNACGLNGPLPNLTTTEKIKAHIDAHPEIALVTMAAHFRLSCATIVSKLRGHAQYKRLRAEFLDMRKSD